MLGEVDLGDLKLCSTEIGGLVYSSPPDIQKFLTGAGTTMPTANHLPGKEIDTTRSAYEKLVDQEKQMLLERFNKTQLRHHFGPKYYSIQDGKAVNRAQDGYELLLTFESGNMENHANLLQLMRTGVECKITHPSIKTAIGNA